MRPRSHNEPLQTLLILRQGNEVHVRDLRAPGVVPTAEMVNRNVLVIGNMRDYIDTLILPELVVIAMRHRLRKPIFVIRSDFQWRCSRTQWRRLCIFANLLAEME